MQKKYFENLLKKIINGNLQFLISQINEEELVQLLLIDEVFLEE